RESSRKPATPGRLQRLQSEIGERDHRGDGSATAKGAGSRGRLKATGDWKVARTRRQECLRHAAQAFQPAGSGNFPVPGWSANEKYFSSPAKRLKRCPPCNEQFYPLCS